MIYAEGPKKCTLAIIGEAPGDTEVVIGRPFVGHSGQLLNNKLHSAGIPRQDCYITYLVKTRVPRNDLSSLWKGKSPSKELLDARDDLMQELCEVDTNCILALGANVLWALLGETKIGNHRGSLYQITLPNGKKVKVVPSYSPSTCLREYALTPVLLFDIKKALKQSESISFDIPKRNLLIAPNKEHILSYIEQCKKNKIVCFDIETAYNSILCISLSYHPNHAISIPTTVDYWSSWACLHEILVAIQKLMDDNEVVKIGQNITFDIQYMMRCWHMRIVKPWHDTMIMQHSCYSELPKSLAFLSSIYTNEPYYKDDLKIWSSTNKTDNEKLWNYNAKDSAVTLECYYALKKEMENLNVEHTYHYMMQLLEPLLFMMLSGLNINRSTVNEIKEELEKDLCIFEQEFREKYGDINCNSSKQMMALATRLGIKIPTKKGKATMDKSAIEKITDKHPAFHLVTKIRNNKKLLSTYLDLQTDKVDNKLRFSMNSTGTETGRLSSSASVFGYGMNMQNVPKKLRHIIVPDPGMVFTEADLIGAEARVVAYESNDPILINLFEQGGNIHKLTANLIWGVTPEQVDEERKKLEENGLETKTMYYKAKRIRHSGNYLGSWVTLSEQLQITAAEAKTLLRRFYEGSPNLVKWHKDIEFRIKQTRTLTTPLGRKRIFFNRLSQELMREAVAYIPQETVAHYINLGIINFYETICKQYKEISVKLQVHDSVLIQHPSDMTSFVHEKMRKLFDIKLYAWGREYNIPLEIKTGSNWRDLEVINER